MILLEEPVLAFSGKSCLSAEECQQLRGKYSFVAKHRTNEYVKHPVKTTDVAEM